MVEGAKSQLTASVPKRFAEYRKDIRIKTLTYIVTPFGTFTFSSILQFLFLMQQFRYASQANT